MTMGRLRLAACLGALVTVAGFGPFGFAHAETVKPPCTAADFARAVDQSGAQLRTFTIEAQPKLQEKMRRYKEARQLPEDEYQDAALEAIQDAKLAEFDQTSSNLLLKVDSLGRVPEGTTPDCSKLDEIKAASSSLLALMKAKSDYMMERLESKIAEAGGAPAAKPKAEADAAANAAKTEAEAKTEKAAKPEKSESSAKTEKAPAAAPPAAKQQQQQAAISPPAKPAEKPSQPWPATTKQNDAYVPAPASPAPAAQDAPAVVAPEANGYSIDEIREATRGFFGGLSTNLASVIEHAFKSSGRPTGYVLGTEGGGAFLAGLRFGKGTLFMRERQESLPVYWHGPSLGSDFGASGSRTLFLIYNMHEPDALFRNFAGVDGSAYVVGGVGFTVLKGGDVIMAPIRTGLGLRVGANVGYIRFTREATWNPF